MAGNINIATGIYSMILVIVRPDFILSSQIFETHFSAANNIGQKYNGPVQIIFGVISENKH